MKNTTQITTPAAIDPAMIAAIIAAMQAPAAAVPANTMALAVSQTVGNADAVEQAQSNARRALQLLDEVNAENLDANQIIGAGLSTCCASNTLQAYKVEFIAKLDGEGYAHLKGNSRGQLKSAVAFICDFGPSLIDHLIIPKGRFMAGKYYGLQSLYKNLKKLGKTEATLPHWLTVNMQVLDELNATLAHIAKNNDFDKTIAMKSIREGLIQTRDILADLVEANRPRTDEEKAAIAKAKEAAKVEAAKAKEAAKPKAK